MLPDASFWATPKVAVAARINPTKLRLRALRRGPDRRPLLPHPMRPLLWPTHPGSLTPPRSRPAVRQIIMGADQQRPAEHPGTRRTFHRPRDFLGNSQRLYSANGKGGM